MHGEQRSKRGRWVTWGGTIVAASAFLATLSLAMCNDAKKEHKRHDKPVQQEHPVPQNPDGDMHNPIDAVGRRPVLIPPSKKKIPAAPEAPKGFKPAGRPETKRTGDEQETNSGGPIFRPKREKPLECLPKTFRKPIDRCPCRDKPWLKRRAMMTG